MRDFLDKLRSMLFELATDRESPSLFDYAWCFHDERKRKIGISDDRGCDRSDVTALTVFYSRKKHGIARVIAFAGGRTQEETDVLIGKVSSVLSWSGEIEVFHDIDEYRQAVGD